MPYTVTATFSGEQRKVETIQPITMYILNASQSGTNYLYYTNYNQDVYGYKMDSSGNLVATEQLYTGIPVNYDEIKTNISGETSEVSISVPNVDRVIESYIQSNNYLRGNEAYIVTTFTKFLPSGATAEHIGTSSDRNAIMKEKMYVDSTSSDEEVVIFSCKPKFIIKNIVVPGRKFSRECPWTYLGTDNCDPYASINSASFTTCDYTLEDCRERSNATYFGGFPSIPRRGIVIL